jgi:hypothetical protein
MQGVGTPNGEGVPNRYRTFNSGDMTVIYDEKSDGDAWIASDSPVEIHDG